MASTLAILVCAALVAVFSGAQGQSAYNPDTQNVYHHFSRQNPTVSQPMILGFPTLIAANFDSSRPTGIVVHSFNAGPTSAINTAVIPAALAALDVNMIAVDWSAGASGDDYDDLISNNVPRCAESIARFIVWLNLQTGATLDQYHLIGFEVGAHMVGLIGRQLNGQIRLITALNPPRQGWNATNMIQATDGVTTETIHTDIFGTGVMEALTDMDFYPNGGLVQPGCFTLDWECSRDRVIPIYEESLRHGGFTSTRCDTLEDALSGNCDSDEKVLMGGTTDRSGSSGIYYLTTNAQSPYSTG